MPYFRFRSNDRILHVYAADSTTARALARRSGNPVDETGEGIVAVGETLPTGANDITPPLYGGGSGDALAAGLDQPTYAATAEPTAGDFSAFNVLGDTTNTGEAGAMAALLANTPAVDPAALSNLNELQRMQGLFRNYARDPATRWSRIPVGSKSGSHRPNLRWLSTCTRRVWEYRPDRRKRI